MEEMRAEDIYDCIDDDAAFARLPGQIAREVDARSAVFHWRSLDGGPLVLADSGYWSPEQMGQYTSLYAEHDIWAQATMTPKTANRPWIIDDLVPDKIYGRSVFYNDWIREMGDDTFHCAGLSMATASGTGLIGLHRARSRGAFQEHNLNSLNGIIAPVQRLMRVRAALAQAREEAGLLGASLDALSLAILIVGRNQRLVHTNRAGDEELKSGRLLSTRLGKVEPSDAASRKLVEAAISRATDPFGPDAGFVDLSQSDGRRLQLTVAPVVHGQKRCAMILIPARQSPRLAEQLQRSYRLTAAEAAVALELVSGKSPVEIADARGVTLLTVRTQLKMVADKLNCRRQSDVVALLVQMGSLALRGGA